MTLLHRLVLSRILVAEHERNTLLLPTPPQHHPSNS